MGKSSAGSVKTRLTNVVVSAVAACCVILTVCHFLVNHAHARRLRRFSASSSLLKFYSLVNHQGNFEEQAPQVPKLDILSVYGEGLPVQEAEFDSADWPELFPVNPTFQPVQSADAKHRRGSAPNVAAQEMLLSGEGALGRIAGYRQPRRYGGTLPETRFKRGKTSPVYTDSSRAGLDKNKVVVKLSGDVASPSSPSFTQTATPEIRPSDFQSSKNDGAIDADTLFSAVTSLGSNIDKPNLPGPSSVSASPPEGSLPASDRPSVDKQDAVPRMPQETPMDTLLDPTKADKMLDKFLYHLKDVAAIQAQQIRSNLGDLSQNADHVQLATGLQEVCTKLKPRDLQPRPQKRSWLSRTFHRLGRAFGAVRTGAAVAKTKIMKWLRFQKNSDVKKQRSKTYTVLRRMASRAWAHTKMFGKKVVAQIMRMLPLFFFVLNTVVLGLSISSVVVAPNPLSIIAVVCAITNILSFAFSEGTRIRGVQLTRSIASRSESQQTELFGLVWADLKAEQDAADISQVPGGEPADAKRKAKTPDAADMEAIKLSQDVDKDSSVPEGELQAPPESQTLKAVRATMYQNLKSNSEKELRDKLKSDIKEAWRSGRWKGLNRILFASLRLLLEYASLGVKNVLEMFGSAWLWVLDHALRKSVRQLRMFKLFGKVSGYGERLFYFMQWWMMTARYYIEYTEAIRDLVAFIIENSSKISMLVQGGLSLVGGTGGPIFFCVFLWKLSKPAWKLYLTDAALKTSSIHERAATEFMMSQKDYHNFLLGTRALVGDADNGPALELHLPQHQTTELIFLMAYLERYKLPQAAHRVGLLEGSNPMQQYLAYERVTRLKELVSRVPQEARGQLVNLFSELSRWDMTRTSDSLHGLIINNLQRCAILYGRRELARMIEKEMRRFQVAGSVCATTDWTRFSSSERKSLPKTLSFLVSSDPRVLTNQYLLQRRILAYIASYQRSRIKPCQLAWLANTVIRCAYEVIDRELLFTLDGDHNYALDRTTVRVNNLPSFLYGDTRGLKELLQKFFTFFPMSVLKHPIRQGTPGRALLADMHLDISSGVIGILRNISPRYGERHTTRAVKRTHCPMQVPTIEINTAMRYVKLRFLTSTTTPAPPATPDPDDNQPSETERSSDTGSEQAATDPLCAEVAARSILRQQVTKAVKGEVRRTIFGIPDTVCAPINSPGFVALSRLIDEFVNGGVTDDQLPEALKTGLDILVNEHPSLVAAFASIHRESRQLAPGIIAAMRRRATEKHHASQHQFIDNGGTSEATGRRRLDSSSPAETAGPPESDRPSREHRSQGRRGTYSPGYEEPYQLHGERSSSSTESFVSDTEASAEFDFEELQKISIFVSNLPQLTRLTQTVRSEAFKHIVLQYVNEVLPLSLSNVAVTKESTSQFLTILGIVQTALRYEPWRLVEYIKDRVLSVHLREQMNDTAELQATALTTHSTGGEAVDGSITATAEASEKKQARDVILDLVAQRFSENLAQIIYDTTERRRSVLDLPRQRRSGTTSITPMRASSLNAARAAESVQLSRKPGKFMYGKTFDQMKDIVTRAFLRCLKSVDNAIGSLERIQGKISTNPSGSLSGPATSQLIEFDSDREGYFESQRGAASNAQDRTEEELKKFLLRRLETEEAEATDQRMIIHTDQTTERKLGEPFFFTKAEIISFLKEGRKAVSDVLEANTEKIVRALRWGYWKEDHFDCLDLSTERTKQLTVDLTAAFKTLLVAKTPRLTKFWTRLRARLGLVPKPGNFSALRIAKDFISRLRVLHQSGVDGTYGAIDLRYSYKEAKLPTSSTHLQSTDASES
uniref:Transmembrane protein n=1 Tax=Neospora caninum (strain Liverpool) TaxID=572307 RepID=A0A0F7ULC3_NEOCL|nr:TPA: hypothetical protein BN1204_064520 [Neospora caninum Liverpool]